MQALLDKDYVSLDEIPNPVSFENLNPDDPSIPFLVKFSLRRKPHLFSKIKPQVQKFLSLKLQHDDYSPETKAKFIKEVLGV